MTTDMHRIGGRRIVVLGFAALALLADRADGLSQLRPQRPGTPGGVIVAPGDPPLAPRETRPTAPSHTQVPRKTSTTVTLTWRDTSAFESGYRIERQVGGRWEAIAALPPDQGSYTATGLAQNTTHCFRIVPWNRHGAPSVPALCATTTQVIGRIAVMVSDLAGLLGELADRSALEYRPGEGVLAPPRSNDMASAPPSFRVPSARKIVYVADTAQIRIYDGQTLILQDDVHLMSGRRGLAQGALLYSDVATQGHSLLEIQGSNVRVSGLRFRGPSAGTDQDLPKAVAISISNALDVVVDHNEFYNWPWAGVRVSHAARATYNDERPIEFSTADRIRITENYFHHNQRQGSGYGVLVQTSSYAYIDKNTFDYNRHAIASTGGRRGYPMNELGEPLDPSRGPEHGYAAYLNLVLDGHAAQKKGGVDLWQTHHFDVHGLENDGLGRDSYDGWAGETIDVAYNSLLCIKGTAFNVRGTPANAAYFRHNVVPEPPTGRATGRCYYPWAPVKAQSDKDNIFVDNTVRAPDPRQQLGVGDFDGDGRDDVFLATGEAFYYSSAGVTEWRFLNQSTRRLSALTLADHNSDGRTDVLVRAFDRWFVSENGTAPFTPLPSSTVVRPGDVYPADELIGDFTGDGVTDRLRYDEDRYFRTVDGVTGAERRSRHRM